MSSTAAYAPVPGAAPANGRAAAVARRIALAVVVLPLAGLPVAVLLTVRRGVSLLDLGLLAGMYAVTSFGVGVGFHRLIAHGSFQTWRWVRALFAVAGSMAAQGPVFYWAAVHRRHHSASDRPDDPHSPHQGRGLVGGLWHAHVGWLFVPEVTDWSHYILDLLRDPMLFAVHRMYFAWVLLGLAIPATVGGLFGGGPGALTGFLWGGLIRIFLVHHITWAVNSICHRYGSRPFRTGDGSRNNFWLALPSFGEGWHNNHHAFPYAAEHGLRWWQFDLNARLIRVLERLGLAWNVKRPGPQALKVAAGAS
jgi:stearoyl-CoA desaturase (delta-9 desaturase)